MDHILKTMNKGDKLLSGGCTVKHQSPHQTDSRKSHFECITTGENVF